MPHFSIIIPVYRVEKYLRRCVDSVLSQTYSDFELILVDDESPDNCPFLCDEYAAQDKRIKVIHKENGGSSTARNAGLDVATGEYILFVDSDDYWSTNEALQKIALTIEHIGPDVVIFGCEREYQSGKTHIYHSSYNSAMLNCPNKAQLLELLALSDNYPPGAWAYCFKRSITITNRIRFIENVTGEDFEFNARILHAAASIKCITPPFYRYTIGNPNSITTKARVKGILGISSAINFWLSIPTHEREQGITENLCFAYLVTLLNFANLSNDEKKNAIDILKNDKVILQLSKRTQIRIINQCINLFGIKPTAWFIAIIHNIM